jgi:hypothetical protein
MVKAIKQFDLMVKMRYAMAGGDATNLWKSPTVIKIIQRDFDLLVKVGFKIIRKLW